RSAICRWPAPGSGGRRGPSRSLGPWGTDREARRLPPHGVADPAPCAAQALLKPLPVHFPVGSRSVDRTVPAGHMKPGHRIPRPIMLLVLVLAGLGVLLVIAEARAQTASRPAAGASAHA